MFFLALPVIELPEIEVEGEPPPAVHDPAEDPAEVPVSTRSQEDIEHLNAHTAADALLGLPGVQLEGSTNQADRAQSVRIRGFASRYTLVLVDGERLTGRDADGSADLSAISTSAIERIDVVRGPLAVLYGGDSIAGVVDVVTAADVDHAAGQLEVGYGSFGTARARGRGQVPLGDFAVRADAAAHVSEGWSDSLDYDRGLDQRTPKEDARPTWSAGGGLQVGYRPVPEHGFELRTRFSRRVRERDRMSHRFVETGRTTGYEDNRDVDVAGQWTADPSIRLRVTTALHLHRYDFDRDDSAEVRLRASGRDAGTESRHDEQVVDGTLFGGRSRLEWWQTDTTSLRVQVEARHEGRRTDDSAERQRHDVNGVLDQDANFRNPSEIYEKSQTVSAASAEQRWRPWASVLCIGGLRGEHDPRWGVDVGAAASAAWRIWPQLAVRYSLGRGFKRPSFDALARPPEPQFDQVDSVWTVGNPDLVPEHALTQEVGLRLMWPGGGAGEGDPRPLPGRVTGVVGLVGFRNDFDDKIVAEQISEWAMTPYPLVRERNVAEAVSQGIEVEARAGYGTWLTVGGSYTWLDTRDETTDTPFDLTPTALAGVYVSVAVPVSRTQVTATLDYVGPLRHYDALGDHRPQDDVDELRLLGVKVEQGMGAGFTAFANLSNGLDWFWDKDGDGDTDLPHPSVFAGLRFEVGEGDDG